MMEWLKNNAATTIIIIILAAVLAIIVRKLIMDRKNGKCSCGCSGCPRGDSCSKKTKR